MTGMTWYATERIVDDRKHEIERDARRTADLHLGSGGSNARRTRRHLRRSHQH